MDKIVGFEKDGHPVIVRNMDLGYQENPSAVTWVAIGGIVAAGIIFGIPILEKWGRKHFH
jgi:hypothetical protein